MASYFGDSTVVTCMRAGLYQQKNGLPVFLGSLRSSQSMTWDDLPKMMLRGGVRHVPVLGSIMPGTSGIPGSGSLLQGGAMACTVVLELMSGKLTCCIASRWYSQPQYSWKPWAVGRPAG